MALLRKPGRTCSAAPARRERRISRMVRNWGAHRGHSRSFSPRLRALKECPHRKCTAGSSRELPLSAHLLFWNTRTCSRTSRSVIKTLHNARGPFHEGLPRTGSAPVVLKHLHLPCSSGGIRDRPLSSVLELISNRVSGQGKRGFVKVHPGCRCVGTLPTMGHRRQSLM